MYWWVIGWYFVVEWVDVIERKLKIGKGNVMFVIRLLFEVIKLKLKIVDGKLLI